MTDAELAHDLAAEADLVECIRILKRQRRRHGKTEGLAVPGQPCSAICSKRQLFNGQIAELEVRLEAVREIICREERRTPHEKI